MITAQSWLGEVTAQSRRGHSSVTARSQLSHGEVTAQSRHLQYDHGWVTAESRLAVTILVTVSSRWAHCELTMSSHGGHFFSHGMLSTQVRIPVGCWCRDVTLGTRSQAWVKPSALVVHSEPTGCHVFLSGLVRMAGCQTRVPGATEEGMDDPEEYDNPSGLLASR